MTDDRLIPLGKIVTPVGLRGEVKLYPYTDRIEHYDAAGVFIGGCKRRINIVRYVKRLPIIRIDGVDDRNQAEELRGAEVFVPESELSDLQEDTYYLKDLIDCRVIDEIDEDLGFISNVLQNGAQDTYEIIDNNGNDFLLPAVKEFIKEVDIENKRVRVRLPKGLRDI